MTIRELAVAVGFNVDNASKNKAESDIKGLGNMAKKVLGAITAFVSISGAYQFAKDCVSMASDVAEMESKFNVVFGEMSEEVNQWATDFAKSVGRNKNTIKTYLADQQNLLVGFGATREEGAKLSEDMTKWALDIASFANMDETAAVNYMTKAVMGETEAAKMLGAVLSDVTRQEAMQELGYSGKYEKLSQLEKMYVNYTAIVKQSADAENDCVNSMGRYESNTRVLRAGLEELKETIGTGLMPLFNAGLKMVIPIVNGATMIIKRITGVGTEVNKLEVFVDKITTAVGKFVDKCGGTENVIRVLAIAIGVLGAWILKMNFTKIINGLKYVGTLMRTVGLSALKFIAIVLLIALAIDDFFNFMKGNDSLIGEIFKKAGVDAEEVRNTIKAAWADLKDSLGELWNGLKEAGGELFETLKIWWAENGEMILGIVSYVFMTMIELIGPVLNAFSNFIRIITALLNGDWQGAWNYAVEFLKSIWDGIMVMWDNLPQGIRDTISNIATIIKEGFQEAIDWITGLPEQALQWGADIINGLSNGIKGAIGGITGAVAGVGEKIKSFLHFSVPDEGPLTTYESWMPDMMKGLAKGINDNRGLVTDQVKALALDMAYLVKSGTADAQSVANGSVTNNSTRTVTQNVSISNSYTGSDMETQKNVSKAMNKSANDATAYMARGLAYTR